MVFLLNKDGVFKCRKSSIKGAGNGVFCAKKVKSGTILPYFGITIRDNDENDEERFNSDTYRTYVISADYTTKYGNQRTARGLSVDGNPRLPEIKRLETFKKLACQTNEASAGSVPNCLLASNPNISRADIKRSLLKKVPIPVSFIVVIKDLPKGTELLTCYGDEYGERDGYIPCKLSREAYRPMVDCAYKHIDNLTKSSQS